MPVPDFSPGEVLTASAMDAIGLWRINEFTLSGGTTNLTNIFSADYANYLLVVSGASTSGAVVDTFQMLNGTTPATGLSYNYSRWTSSSPSTASQLKFQSAGGIITTGSSPQSFTINISNPFLAAKTTINTNGQYGANTDEAYIEMISAIHTLSTSYNGISFIATGTTWTAGKVTVYGYR
jgi:hypothetical protein